MQPPNTTIPPIPAACSKCGDAWYHPGVPDALIIEYNSHPAHPEYRYVWVCDDCVLAAYRCRCQGES
jgi:hypothetical protein